MKFLFDFIAWLFGVGDRTPLNRTATSHAPTLAESVPPQKRQSVRLRSRRHLVEAESATQQAADRTVAEVPYLFATFASDHRRFLDLTPDGDEFRLQRFGLPTFHTPQELANWLGIRVGELAWLVHRGVSDRRPPDEQRSHYVYRWIKKRSASLEAGAPNSRPVQTQWRLIEAPKQTLKAAQRKILTEILEKVPAHSAAHGFVRGRSIVTNARPHVGQAVVIKLDLQNFYPNVTYSRVVAIFRSIGYCREAAIWLARLTTSAVPWSLNVPDGDEGTKSLYVIAREV